MKRTTIAFLSVSAAVLLLAAPAMARKDKGPDDSQITSAVEASLASNDDVKAEAVEVETSKGIVHLTGALDTGDARREATRLAWRAEGVTGVVNKVTVGESRAGDDKISTTVKAHLIGNSWIKSSDVDVSCSEGVVTLIGLVDRKSLKANAESVARKTEGVTDVNNELFVGKIER